MESDTSRNQIWREIIGGLNKSHLEYVLVGGAALVVHGLPRSTLDMDIYIPAKEEVLVKLFELADGLGLKSEQRSILDLRNTPRYYVDQWICFSYGGRDVLDVFLAPEKAFNNLYKNSVRKGNKRLAVRVASLADVSAMKKISGRPVDFADLKLIEESKKYRKN